MSIRENSATVLALLTLLMLPTLASPAAAHAFGARYDLPLPLWLFLAGAGLAVALSFVVMALFVRPGAGSDLHVAGGLRLPGSAVLGNALCGPLRGLSVALFVLILVAAFLGPESPIRNIAPVLVWVVWWVGFAILTALLGNIWPTINPWAAIFSMLRRRPAPGADSRKRLFRYPERLGCWPAAGLFLIFVWFELISEAGDRPATLGWLIAVFSLATWAGMTAFGAADWRDKCDPFERFFGLLGRFAPLYWEGGLRLRPYGAGLAQSGPAHSSVTGFVMVMLAAVTFDGFVETPAWAALLGALEQSEALRPALLAADQSGLDLLTVIKTVALLLSPLAFAAVYGIFAWLSAACAERRLPAGDIANALAPSLVPIAIGYHIAHYLSYLLLAGQLVVPLASDPFGRGWDLFGTAGYSIDITIINAKTVWYVAVAAIVLGHVAAVYAAHVTAQSIYRDRRLALRSQMPMLVLMVLYTMSSLWILSQPIIAD